MIKVIHGSRKDASMSSLLGYISTTYNELVNSFGNPTNIGSSDDKVTAEWILKVGNKVITIYDYKEKGTPKGYYNWHVGGHDIKSLTLLKNLVEYKNMDAEVTGGR